MVLTQRRLAKHPEPPSGIVEFLERVQTEWEKIGVEECQVLIKNTLYFSHGQTQAQSIYLHDLPMSDLPHTPRGSPIPPNSPCALTPAPDSLMLTPAELPCNELEN
ncbi:hypothetical protein SERLA73DRAFT_70113 [Serpula lacrymans var. lacrymans S7.3]|uniref:Uncharacterized protein n=1 Tax=Serpula lacrymans var. lacrymans (strain S7.3) TaxID=936435 RepID=F8PLY1_SERL3|nr:hypothetical protein SERLA73DRAFT_70113 [Serpula lacrymans var. lacrymans S7.3]